MLTWVRRQLFQGCPSRRQADEARQGEALLEARAEEQGPSDSVVVGDDVTPGVSKAAFVVGGRSIEITVPKAACVGDTLTLRQEGVGGEWRLDIKRASKGRAATIRAVVPGDARPGHTEVLVDTLDGNHMKVVVPGHAEPGNLLLLSRGTTPGNWQCSVLPITHNLQPPEPRESESEVAAYLALRDKACLAGAAWSTHLMRRPSQNPEEISGMISLVDFPAGAELGRVPQSQLLNRQAISKAAPEFTAAVEALLHMMPTDQRSLPLQVVYLTKLLARAEARAGLGIRPQFSTEQHPLPGMGELDLDELWNGYADAIVNETLPEHPFRQALQDPVKFRESMAPSPEGALIEVLAAGVLIRYEVLTERLGYEHLGAAFTAERFLRAWLLTISRSFELEGTRETMIPHMDGFNHAAQGKENARVRWDDDAKAMLLEATRDIAAGEEVLFFYDANSNPVLFRTYGFTVPPWEEPRWTVVSMPLTVQSVLQEFFPAGSPWRGKIIEFSSEEVHPTLQAALAACSKAGGSATSFLRALLSYRLTEYLKDGELQRVVAIILEDSEATDADLDILSKLSSSMRVKLSECLCYSVYTKALQAIQSGSPAASEETSHDGLQPIQHLQQMQRVSSRRLAAQLRKALGLNQ